MLNRRRFVSLLSSLCAGLAMSGAYSLFVFRDSISWPKWKRDQRGSIKPNRYYSPSFILNARSNIVHWPNPSIFLSGATVSKSHMQEVAKDAKEMKGILDQIVKTNHQNRKFNRKQVGLAFEYVSIADIQLEDGEFIGLIGARDFLAAGVDFKVGISRRQLDLLGKLAILSVDLQEDAYRFLLEHIKTHKNGYPSEYVPEWLTDINKFDQHWNRVRSIAGRNLFKKSISKRQTEFKGLVF